MFIDEPTDDVIVDQNTDGGVTTDEGQAADESGDHSAPGTQNVNDEVDEKGVSYKNRFFELERKYENLNKSIPQMIQEAATAAATQTGKAQQTQNEYTIADYVKAKQSDPQNAAYYEAKIEEIRDRKIAETIRQELTQVRTQTSEEQVRQQAEAWAVNTFPKLRDINDPFTQEVLRQYNSRPAAKREPHDFAIAAELVAARMGIKPVTQSNPQQAKLQQQDRKVKSLLKERTLEGDGRGAITPSAQNQRQKDYAAAQAKGDFTAYIAKYHLKPVESD